MSESLQVRQPKKQGKISRFINRLMGLIKSSDLSQQENIQELRLNLYDTPRKILVERFYDIMETGNLLLLMVDQKKEINVDLLNNVWIELQDYYYSNTNKQSFNKFKRNINAVTKLKAEITACKAGFELVKIGVDGGYEILKKFRINSTDLKLIKSAILQKETMLSFAKNKLTVNGKKESIRFYKSVISIEGALNRQLTMSEITLDRWIEYVEQVREKNEIMSARQNKVKRKRNGR